MPQGIEKSMITPMVQQIMVNNNDPETWRKEIIRAQIFDAQEAKDLSDREISLIHHALLVQRFSQMTSDELVAEAEKHKIQYHLSFDQDDTMHAGAISY